MFIAGSTLDKVSSFPSLIGPSGTISARQRSCALINNNKKVSHRNLEFTYDEVHQVVFSLRAQTADLSGFLDNLNSRRTTHGAISEQCHDI